MLLSIVIPVYNEEENLPELYRRLKPIAELYNHEIIFIDDGSSDDSWQVLLSLAEKDQNVKLIRFRRNFGQTSALYAGFEFASGDVIVTMDADLQNDPSDIPRLIEVLNNGYHIVSGWRKDRKDSFLSRRLPSMIANWLISKVTGIRIHDFGCTLKAYRSQVVKNFELYGDLHRFLPALGVRLGAKITEIPVKHHPRLYGKSKYGISRTLRVLLDIFLVKFLNEYISKPMYVFGSIGAILFLIGSLSVLYLVFIKLLLNQDIGDRPLLLMGIMCVLAGIQLLSTGILAELLVRIYYSSKSQKPYYIQEVVNFNLPEPPANTSHNHSSYNQNHPPS
ncbi:MAG: glycosyltransferase family 2 protein [Aquificaceae bacterium]|nr:glycosyltransferase family 2 protein [Aquificaceae bacterium]MDW8237639.1 glycosyltransferase family 2 protein [Aquificaceae bacterium]